MSEQTPDETAEELTARTRSSAQSTAQDLARMGIDPRALGLDAELPPQTGAPAPSESVDDPAGSAVAEPQVRPPNVVPLRPDDALPAAGTSSAWAPSPTAVSSASPRIGGPSDPMDLLLGGEREEVPSRSTL